MRRSRSRSTTTTTTFTYSRSPTRSPSLSPTHSPSLSLSRSRSPSYRPSSPAEKRRVSGEREEGSSPEGTRVHVGSLASETSSRDLHRLFGPFGEILDLWMARTRPCFAFVVFRHRRDALKAIRGMDGELLNNRRIRVTIARPRTKGTRSGGAFNPYLRCYRCGRMGHFSRICRARHWGAPPPPSPRSHAARHPRREMKVKPEARYTGNSRHAKRLCTSGDVTYRKS
ncbi:hypothetical protein ACOMHN_019501 [Nucella lapillus]